MSEFSVNANSDEKTLQELENDIASDLINAKRQKKRTNKPKRNMRKN